MTKWKKPSGVVVEANDLPANVAAAEALGWKRADDPKPDVEPKKRGRPAKSKAE